VGTVGWSGILILALAVLLLFGPRRLPQLGRQLGRGMRELNDSVRKPAREIQAALEAPREARAALGPGAQLKAALLPPPEQPADAAEQGVDVPAPPAGPPAGTG
jgi:sec-independent protein translocase protein TatA